MESGQLRSLDIRNPYPRLDPDPRRNLPTSSRVPVRRVVVQSGPSRVGTQSGDNYSVGRYPDIPPSAAEGDWEIEVADRVGLHSWQNAVEREMGGPQAGPRDPHVVESVNVENSKAAAPIDQYLGQSHVVDDGIDDERVGGWSSWSKMIGVDAHLSFFGTALPAEQTSRSRTFC